MDFFRIKQVLPPISRVTMSGTKTLATSALHRFGTKLTSITISKEDNAEEHRAAAFVAERLWRTRKCSTESIKASSMCSNNTWRRKTGMPLRRIVLHVSCSVCSSNSMPHVHI